jgi:hypothetical protein
MATLNHYVYDLKELLRNHHIVDEDYLTNDMLEFWIITQRSMWVKRRDRAFIHTDHSLMQTIIAEVDSIDRSFIPESIPVIYKTLRTTQQIPKLINFESWDGVISAGPVDMWANRFNHCEYEEAVRSGYGRFNKSQIFSFTLNDYLYIVSKSRNNFYQLITRIAVTGIFEDPRAVGEFKHIDGTSCWTADDEYPISLELWNFMKAEILNLNIDSLYRIPVDRSADDNSSKQDIA